MRTVTFLVLIALVCVFIQAQQPADTLDNAAVIALSKIGLQPSVIINKINSSYCSFDVSTDALIDLSKNGVEAQVITAMMDINNAALAQAETEMNSTNPSAMHNAGIYYYDAAIAENPLTRLEPIKANHETHSGGYGGWGGSSTYARMNGLSANYKINNSLPVFYFYFPTNQNNTDRMFAASSPNDFELVKLKPEKNSRVVKVGGGSSFGYGSTHSASIPDNFKVSFSMEKIGEGIYKITPQEPLVYGEYCFVYMNDTDRVFDFSITVK